MSITRPHTPQRMVARVDRAWARPVEVDALEPARTLAGLPARSRLIRLVMDHEETLRALALSSYRPPVARELEVIVRHWRPPAAGWSGRLGPVRWLVGSEQHYPDKGSGEARIVLRTSRPVELRVLAAAAYRALAPTNDGHGAAPRVVVAPGAPAGVLALLPTALPASFEGKPSPHLRGTGLPDADVALVRGSAQAERHGTGPEATRSRSMIEIDGSGHAFAESRRARPLIDLRVHRPVGRLASFGHARSTAELTQTSDGALVLSTTGVTGDATSTSVVIDPRRAVTPTAIAAVRDVEHISLATFDRGARESHLSGLLPARLTELAASGAILHSLPAATASQWHGVSPTLIDLLTQDYRPVAGLARDLRSVTQRTAAMRDHGGLFELSEVVEKNHGRRILPSVSVVMSTMRPSRAVQALAMLARQSYPHLEIVAAFHGVPVPHLPTGDHTERPESPPVTAFEVPGELAFGDALAAAARRASGDLIVKVDDDDWYGTDVIWDLVLAYLYSGAQVVGKTTEYLHFENLGHTVHRTFAQECFHTQVAGGAMMLSRADYEAIGGWRPTSNSTDRSILLGISRAGGLAYRTHGLGYVYVRHEDGHTWSPEDSQLFDGSFEQWPGRQHAILDHHHRPPGDWQVLPR